MQQRHETQTNDLAYLVGKRLVVASEGDRGQKLAESKIKKMTGRERIPCRHLYQEYFEYEPQFKLWLATNDLPEIKGMDEAIWRRIRLIEFPVRIPPEEQDKELPDRLIGELPGILQWALQGLKHWREHGLAAPECVKRSTKSYRDQNDSVGQWIESACICASGSRASMKALSESYKVWCENSSLDALPNTVFGKELGRRGFEVIKTSRGNDRKGIGLKEPVDMMK
jgi:putative DNA primase/helicase